MQPIRFPWRSLIIVVLVALIGRILLLASNTVSFNSDEAIVALMARHILQGSRPTFFYGQPYMGSLDAWFIALGFRLLGESVLTVRLVQSFIYLLVVASSFLLAWKLSMRTVVATVAGLVMVLPPVVMALYTTTTLGGYNETLLLGNLLLLLGYEVTHGKQHSWLHWLLLGFCAGLGWWTNGLIIVYALPVAGLILLDLYGQRRQSGRVFASNPLYLALALVGFLAGSAPWWIFDFTHDHAALSIFLTHRQIGEFAGIGIPYAPPQQRALGLLIIGLPTLFGMRFPWAGWYFLLPLGVAVILIHAVAVYWLLRRNNPLCPDARGLLLGMVGLFCLIFVASHFGADPTGRYFLPLVLPMGIVLGTLAETLWQQRKKIAAVGLVGLVIGYYAAGQIAAARLPEGLTTQFDLISHIPNRDDAALIAFLDEHNIAHGYTNYWVAFRMAFLSQERLQLSSALPYKSDLSYNAADNRYVPYVEATAQAKRIAYITTNLPELDTLLEAGFAEQGISYQEARIGVYHVYYEFSPRLPQLPDLSAVYT